MARLTVNLTRFGGFRLPGLSEAFESRWGRPPEQEESALDWFLALPQDSRVALLTLGLSGAGARQRVGLYVSIRAVCRVGGDAAFAPAVWAQIQAAQTVLDGHAAGYSADTMKVLTAVARTRAGTSTVSGVPGLGRSLALYAAGYGEGVAEPARHARGTAFFHDLARGAANPGDAEIHAQNRDLFLAMDVEGSGQERAFYHRAWVIPLAGWPG